MPAPWTPWIKSGQLKAVKLGRRNMITAKSVEELVAAQ